MDYATDEIIQLMDNLHDLDVDREPFGWEHVGLRFEEKAYKVGDIISDSKANPDRVDERDFPDFNLEEYEDLPELPGVSTWVKEAFDGKDILEIMRHHKHAYIVVGNDDAWYGEVDGIFLDLDELVIENGQVAVVLK
ncbi:hypothetical protein [Enterococcus nangangensis]|uniref:hypothetical protein n=1 Tax=Enterococcus nangangensis TaxID=2559926 RepID=UPI0010F9D689|nr:hypothetical protein [Enterococcus nangangensis]